jgi:hypothetical protein
VYRQSGAVVSSHVRWLKRPNWKRTTSFFFLAISIDMADPTEWQFLNDFQIKLDGYHPQHIIDRAVDNNPC